MKKIYIAFCGKYNNAIGPVQSMIVIYEILKKSHNCSISSNLKSKENIKKGLKKKPNHLAKIAKYYLSPLIDIYYIFVFNINVFKNIKSDVIIITQPFLIVPVKFFGIKLIYTRRANVLDKVLIANSATKRVFERVFYLIQNYQTIYLVPQASGSTFIPNAFDINRINPQSYTLIKKCYFAGTWNKRKGSEEMKELLDKGILKKIIAFGEIHESLPKGVDHKGVVKNPSYLYMPGDIYLSFSSLEGLQRSVMEALIRGCFVICLKRPDSLFLSQSPLVYVVNNLLEVENTLLKIDSISLESYQKMYEENYKFLSSKFSKKVIQEKWLSLT